MHPYRNSPIVEDVTPTKGKKTLLGKLRTYYRKYLINKYGTYLSRHGKKCKCPHLQIYIGLVRPFDISTAYCSNSQCATIYYLRNNSNDYMCIDGLATYNKRESTIVAREMSGKIYKFTCLGNNCFEYDP